MKLFILLAALVAFSAPVLANEPTADTAAQGKMAKGKKSKKGKKKKDEGAAAEKPADKPADAPKAQ